MINNRKENIKEEDKVKILSKLLETERIVSGIAKSEIVFSPALITMDGDPIIRRGTINIIQGKSGSHKSRFAETICSMLIRTNPDFALSLGFEKVENEDVIVCYVDTERNKKEEFPMAIQSIMLNAGFERNAHIPNFRYTSLKDIERGNRLHATQLFIEDTRRKNPTVQLFVILDVATDCVYDFNDPVESMALFDYLGKITEDHGATILLTIHENPGSDKARGHIGTEGVNKSATVFQIGFVKGANNEMTNLLKIKFIKLRHSKSKEPISVLFSEETKKLVLADPSFVKLLSIQRQNKAPISELISKLGEHLKPSMSQQLLLSLFVEEFKCSPNTVKTRLNEIIENSTDIINHSGVPCKLKSITEGKTTVYKLVEIQIDDLM